MSFELWQLLVLCLAGVAAGWVNVLAGGGSLLTVPFMLFMGVPGPVANGTNRVAIIAQNITAVTGFFRNGFSDFRLSASLAVVASIGAFFGAQIGAELSGVWFDRTIAVIILGVMIIMATDRGQATDQRPGKPKNLVLGHVLFLGAGFWGGFIQIAVGFIMMPILYRVMGLDLVRVNMHKVFIALIFSFVSLLVFANKVGIAWELGGALAIGNAIGGWIGANTAVAKGAPFIKKTLFVVLAAMAVKLLFF
ncbi:MAG: sulfite exporter TauE/SafE family protein [Parvularculaceae bacterium]|nr:MAG: sulfite exporter TauE/SafE family protein [Parvularculaceae bacterium]